VCINRRTTFGSQFSLPSMWDPGPGLRWSGCVVSPVTCGIISQVLVGVLTLAFPILTFFFFFFFYSLSISSGCHVLHWNLAPKTLRFLGLVSKLSWDLWQASPW
jgi:hypothetical protein